MKFLPFNLYSWELLKVVLLRGQVWVHVFLFILLLVNFEESPFNGFVIFFIICFIITFPRPFFLFYLILLLTWFHHVDLVNWCFELGLLISVGRLSVLNFHNYLWFALLFGRPLQLRVLINFFLRFLSSISFITSFFLLLRLIFLLNSLGFFFLALWSTSSTLLRLLFNLDLSRWTHALTGRLSDFFKFLWLRFGSWGGTWKKSFLFFIESLIKWRRFSLLFILFRRTAGFCFGCGLLVFRVLFALWKLLWLLWA